LNALPLPLSHSSLGALDNPPRQPIDPLHHAISSMVGRNHAAAHSVCVASRHLVTSESKPMSGVASVASFARTLIKREQFREGGDMQAAIQRVARRFRLPANTIGNLVRNRVKSVCFTIGQAIITAAINDIENEKRQLEHEHQAIVAMGQNADPSALAKVEEGLSIAREGLAEMRAAR